MEKIDSAPLQTAIILPCHNEATSLPATIAGFRAVLGEVDIVVCDNGSTDTTAAVARACGAEVISETRLGKGEAVRRLFAEVEADVYIMADGDATYQPGAAVDMVRLLVEGRLDMVVGHRLGGWGRQGGEAGSFRPGHRFGNWFFTTAVQLLFGHAIRDLLSGYRVFSRRFVKTFPAESRGFEIETELTVHALEQRLPVAEWPCGYSARRSGSSSKLSTFKDGAAIFLTILRLLSDVAPLRFYGTLALLSVLTGAWLSLPIVETFMVTGMVPRIPTVVLITGLLVLAVVFFTSGIILERVSAMRRGWLRLAYLQWPGGRPGGAGRNASIADAERQPAGADKVE